MSVKYSQMQKWLCNRYTAKTDADIQLIILFLNLNWINNNRMKRAPAIFSGLMYAIAIEAIVGFSIPSICIGKKLSKVLMITQHKNPVKHFILLGIMRYILKYRANRYRLMKESGE